MNSRVQNRAIPFTHTTSTQASLRPDKEAPTTNLPTGMGLTNPFTPATSNWHCPQIALEEGKPSASLSIGVSIETESSP
ncbi:hypothetical protein TNIN_257121 [Trichonephila inaurata madagascariensis]|uniref:Uncharacterized protein n=1 Tax=Trichonephila inaurata madagascariensis TaxID=2747483 RepID=A0A8X6YGR2_9ARAC|nr:hypothetical protein TNIN_257121 [Trichonephila inaurata madagascariensis]